MARAFIHVARAAVVRFASARELRFDHPTRLHGVQISRAIISLRLRARFEFPTRQKREHAANAFEIEAALGDQSANARDPMHVRVVEEALAAGSFVHEQQPFAFIHAKGFNGKLELPRDFADLEPIGGMVRSHFFGRENSCILEYSFARLKPQRG